MTDNNLNWCKLRDNNANMHFQMTFLINHYERYTIMIAFRSHCIPLKSEADCYGKNWPANANKNLKYQLISKTTPSCQYR